MMSPLEPLPADTFFHRILRFERLSAVFQPIVSFDEPAVMGFEGLIRGPEGTPLESPAALFAEAERHGLRTKLEAAAARTVVTEFARQKLPGHLLINMSCTTLLAAAEDSVRMLGFLEDAGMAPSNVVIELTEHDRVHDVPGLARQMEPFRKAGMSLALDDFGDGHSNLRLWMELHPRFVKIDKFFVQGLATNGDKFEMVRLLQRFAESFGTELVAEGVEEMPDLIAARELGIAYGQGFLLARPTRRPQGVVAAEVAAALRPGKPAMPTREQTPAPGPRFAGDLMFAEPPVAPTLSSNALVQMFSERPECIAVAVVDEERPVGIINRQSFMDRYARPFHRELYGRKPCTHYMEGAPLVVDRRTPLEVLRATLAGADQRYLRDGFIVTDNGRYVGLGSGEALVRAVTELRIEAARYANPLTFLPGNIPIHQHVEALLAQGARFVACYADLNDFKPFNDQFGYLRGDELICLAAGVLQRICDPLADFVGHIGGDDFFLVMQSEDWQERCQSAIASFAEAVCRHFREEDLREGGFWAENRQGTRSFFPLTSISIGAVIVDADCPLQAEDVGAAAAVMKRQAKMHRQGLRSAPLRGVIDQVAAPNVRAVLTAA